MDLYEYIAEAHNTAVVKGFWKNRGRNTALLLIHAEVSEAVEALRKGNFKEYDVELADIAIRLFDLMGYEKQLCNEDAENSHLYERIIQEKMKKNLHRPYKHNKKF